MSIFKLLFRNSEIFLLPSHHSRHSQQSIETTHIFRDGKVGASLFDTGAAVFKLVVPFLVLRHSPEKGWFWIYGRWLLEIQMYNAQDDCMLFIIIIKNQKWKMATNGSVAKNGSVGQKQKVAHLPLLLVSLLSQVILFTLPPEYHPVFQFSRLCCSRLYCSECPLSIIQFSRTWIQARTEFWYLLI